MHHNLHALEQSLDDNPDDTLVRLAYADALEFDGQTEQAEFQRLLVRHRVWPQKDEHYDAINYGKWRLFTATNFPMRPCYIGHIGENGPWRVSYESSNPRIDLEKQLQEWPCWKQFVEENNERPEESESLGG